VPEGLRQSVTSWISPGPVAGDGWAYVGTLAQKDDTKWTRGPGVKIVTASPAADRQYPIRQGDQVRILERTPQIIIDFKERKNQNIGQGPTKATGEIDPETDHSGLFYEAGYQYKVTDVDVDGNQGRDRVMYLRLDK
jgi:hypothetical protein